MGNIFSKKPKNEVVMTVVDPEEPEVDSVYVVINGFINGSSVTDLMEGQNLYVDKIQKNTNGSQTIYLTALTVVLV